MVGEQYYLFLVKKDETLIRVGKGRAISIEEMDKKTTKYLNQEELIDTILKNTNSSLSLKDILNIVIKRKPNSKKEIYYKENGPLFSEDASVLNENKIRNDFARSISNPVFVLKFIKGFAQAKGLRGLVNEIESEINNKDSYNEDFNDLISKVSKTYKGRRNMYLFMKSFNSKSIDSKDFIPTFTDEEIKEMELEYLKEHDRELLDIEDFNGFRELSPFDNKRKH